MVNDTSAIPIGFRPSVPLKMTSAISPPRSALADCSPSTHRMASDTLDFPHPFGPTMAVTPGWKFSDVLSAKDLKPNTVKFLRYMLYNQPKPNQVKGTYQYLEQSCASAQRTGEEPRFELCCEPGYCSVLLSFYRIDSPFGNFFLKKKCAVWQEEEPSDFPKFNFARD